MPKLNKHVMKKDINYLLLIFVAFGLYFMANEMYFAKIYYFIQDIIPVYPLSFFLTYSVIGLPIFIFVYFANNGKFFTPLGLNSNIIKGILFSFIFSIPMFIGYGILAGFQGCIDWERLWLYCLFAAFFEEFYYRGFFFGQIYQKTRFGFIPSLLVSALVFASLHLYQSSDFSTLVGIFITTFLGAGLFAWLFVEWDYNLWMPIGLHFFMNLSWEIFSMGDNALGDLNANLIRGLTIAFAIVGTILYKQQQGKHLAINRNTLWMKKLEKQV